MKNVTHHCNYNPLDHPGERFTLPSMTVQGAVLPLAKMLTTYVISPPDASDYYDDEQLAAYARLDEFEKEEVYREVVASVRSSRPRREAPEPEPQPGPSSDDQQ